MAIRTASATGSCFSLPEPVAEGLSLHERHHVEEEGVRLPRVEEGKDVGVLQVGGEPDLREEALGPDHRGQLRPEHLHRDPAVVAEVLREVDRRHPARADLVFEPIARRKGRPKPTEELGQVVRLVMGCWKMMWNDRFG